MPLTTYRLGEWVPDAGDYFGDNDGVLNIKEVNAFCPTAFGYRQINRFKAIDDDTSFITGLDTDSPKTFDLYSYTVEDGDTTKNEWIAVYNNTLATAAGIKRRDYTGAFSSIGRAGGYTDTRRSRWNFTRYGDTLIGTNGVDAIQRSTISGTTVPAFAKNNDTSGTPTAADPRASFVETFKGHLFIGDFDLTAGTSGAETYGAAFGALSAARYRTGIWHSALDNERRFGTPDVTPAILGSDYRLFYDGLGAVTGLKSCFDYMVICRQRGIMILTGPPFNVQVLDDSVGCLYSKSLVRSGQDVYLWTRKGPAVIRNGSSIEYLGINKITRTFEEIASNSIGYENNISSAVTIDGRYVVWSVGLLHNSLSVGAGILLIYSVEDDAFSMMIEPGVPDISAMASYSIPVSLGNVYDQGQFVLDGVSFLGSSQYRNTSSGFSLVQYLMTPAVADDSYTSVGTAETTITSNTNESKAVLKTCYFRYPSDETVQSWRIQTIRPIYNNDGYLNIAGNPGFDNKLYQVRIYPRSKYSTIDHDGSYEKDANSYVTFSGSSLLSNGALSTDGCPNAEMFSIEFYFDNEHTMRTFYGFEISFDLGMAYSTGKGVSGTT